MIRYGEFSDKTTITVWDSWYATTGGRQRDTTWGAIAIRMHDWATTMRAGMPPVIAFASFRGECNPENCTAAAKKGHILPRHRCNAAVETVYALAIDHDKGQCCIYDAIERVRKLGRACLFYETKSSTLRRARFRAIFPLASPWEKPSEWSRVYQATRAVLEDELGLELDHQCSSPSQAWSLPRGTALTPLVEWIDGMAMVPLEQEKPAPFEPVIREIPRARKLVRARAMAQNHPPAIAGQGGSGITFALAAKLVRGLCLSEEDALEVMLTDYNPRCKPPWSRDELRHKIESTSRADAFEYGSLLNQTHPLLVRLIIDAKNAGNDRLFDQTCKIYRCAWKCGLDDSDIDAAISTLAVDDYTRGAIEAARRVVHRG